MTGATEQPLPGGFVNHVVRVGETVRRPPAPRAVRDLLRHLERHGWPGAPRHRGIDARGREILTWLDGHVAWEPDQPEAVRGEPSLARVAELVREFHDLTAGTALAADGEVVCHNDLSPRNTVYRDDGLGLRPVAFLDWDIAAPGRRIHDLAHACWQYVGLGPDVADPAEAGRLVRVMCDAYRLTDRGEVVDTILWWQGRCWRGIEAGALAGDPAMEGLRDGGAVDAVRAAHDWVTTHRGSLDRALS